MTGSDWYTILLNNKKQKSEVLQLLIYTFFSVAYAVPYVHENVKSKIHVYLFTITNESIMYEKDILHYILKKQ